MQVQRVKEDACEKNNIFTSQVLWIPVYGPFVSRFTGHQQSPIYIEIIKLVLIPAQWNTFNWIKEKLSSVGI